MVLRVVMVNTVVIPAKESMSFHVFERKTHPDAEQNCDSIIVPSLKEDDFILHGVHKSQYSLVGLLFVCV